MPTNIVRYSTMKERLFLVKLEHLVPAWMNATEARIAMREYLHFFFLVWTNLAHGNRGAVVPTTRADALWHNHLQRKRSYRTMCHLAIGQYVHHLTDEYAEGSAALAEAIAYTKQLHTDYGSKGFVEEYLGVRARQASGDSSGSVPVAPLGEAPATDTSIGHSGAGSCAAGCASG